MLFVLSQVFHIWHDSIVHCFTDGRQSPFWVHPRPACNANVNQWWEGGHGLFYHLVGCWVLCLSIYWENKAVNMIGVPLRYIHVMGYLCCVRVVIFMKILFKPPCFDRSHKVLVSVYRFFCSRIYFPCIYLHIIVLLMRPYIPDKFA